VTYLGVKADHLVVSTTVAALADHSLGNTVQRSQLDIIELAILVPRARLQVAQALLETGEFALENVGLIDLVGEND
jgi:hypothetical protein